MNRKYNTYDFFSHQPYLERNRIYCNYRPMQNDILSSVVWEAYQVDNFDSQKDIALPDICADIMTLYTKNNAYCYFMGGTENTRSMKELKFIDDVTTICGIKFCPGTIGNILKGDLCDAGGSKIDARDVMYNGMEITEQLKHAQNFPDRMQVFRAYLMNRMNDGYEVDAFANYVTKRILETHGLIKISDIAEETGYTDRYLRRVVSQKLGMRVKTFSQIVQMQWSYHLRNEALENSINLAYLAQLCGYYDQSHMNATYKKLTGFLPSAAFQLYDENN